MAKRIYKGDSVLKREALSTHRMYRKLMCNSQGKILNFLLFSTSSHDNIAEVFFDLKSKNAELENLIKENENYEMISFLKKNIMLMKSRFFKRDFKKYRDEITEKTNTIINQIIIDAHETLLYDIDNRTCRICFKKIDELGVLRKIVGCQENSNKSYDDDYYVHGPINDVFERQDYYVCNDIPSELLKNDYLNPRIKTHEEIVELCKDKGRDYKEKLKWLRNNWQEAWNDGGNEREEAYYQSSLIIPLSLKHTKSLIKPELNSFWYFIKRKIDFSKTGNPYEKRDRGPFGYLCFDSTIPNYFDVKKINSKAEFNRSLHLNLGYFLADFISIILFIHYSYGIFSEIYTECEKMYVLFKKEEKEFAF
ncbi:hypothetical protein LJC41_01295 [Desulfosarcina sp. OttesenSCG-928-G17]|nr:hypothetical protein [Desulfosarcina sp. OttesenSCG-928-G17]